MIGKSRRPSFVLPTMKLAGFGTRRRPFNMSVSTFAAFGRPRERKKRSVETSVSGFVKTTKSVQTSSLMMAGYVSHYTQSTTAIHDERKLGKHSVFLFFRTFYCLNWSLVGCSKEFELWMALVKTVFEIKIRKILARNCGVRF